MVKRQIIKIDEEKCNGCGECIPNCPEGALKIIDAKARLLSDLFCDGLGACIGHCPQGAITFEEREAEAYDERKVMSNIIKQGENVIIEHLRHLRGHKQMDYFKQAVDFLAEKGASVDVKKIFTQTDGLAHSGCPGAKTMDFRDKKSSGEEISAGEIRSQLRQWPIQLHLVSPLAPYYQGADVLLSVDCVAYALGNFHPAYLKGKAIAIACPKLDENQDVYKEKIKSLIDDAKINTLTVMIMQVPCCRGLFNLVKEAIGAAKRKIPIKLIVVGIEGEIISEEWAQV